MKEEREDRPRRKSESDRLGNMSGSDRLGKLLARYSALPKGFVLLGVAIAVALLGLLVVWKSGDISRTLFDNEGLKGVYATMGWVLFGFGLLFAALSPTYLMQWVEVRKKGVRHRRLFGTRELHWDDVDQIEIRKVTIVDPGRGRRSSYRINFHSSDEPAIHLRATFLAAVNTFALIQMLKMYGGGVPMDSDEDLGRDDDDHAPRLPRIKKRKRRREDERPSGDVGIFQQARKKLADGQPTDVVESWLRDQGVAPAAAAAMIDKILTKAARRMAMEAEAAEEEDNLTRQAREQLAAGTDPEKVKRWLHQQGVSPNMASAIVADLRQQLL